MSDDTYWLKKRDAEFAMRILKTYGSATKADMERDEHTCPGDPVYEITIRAHDSATSNERDFYVKHPTLREALIAEAEEHEAGGCERSE